jgi:predicted hydrocarbon binding protein
VIDVVIGLLLKLFMTHQVKMEEGLISLKDINLNLLPSSVAATLTNFFTKRSELWKLYAIMWLNGFITIKHIEELYKMKRSDQIYSFGMDMGEAMGLGLYKTHDYFPGKYTHFIIKPNPYIPYYSRNLKREPIDYFIAGTMAGGGCVVHKQPCQTVEIKCMFKGDECCEFVTGTEKELKRRKLWKIAEKRYNLKDIYPVQKAIFKNYGKVKMIELIDGLIKKLI